MYPKLPVARSLGQRDVACLHLLVANLNLQVSSLTSSRVHKVYIASLEERAMAISRLETAIDPRAPGSHPHGTRSDFTSVYNGTIERGIAWRTRRKSVPRHHFEVPGNTPEYRLWSG